MTYKQFLKRILEDEQFLDAEARRYIRKQARRTYTTYKFCLKNLKNGDKILSLGGYYVTLEKLLAEALDLEITVVDYPKSIEFLSPYYDFLGFKYVGLDLSQGLSSLPSQHFDMIIYTEVIEHIPASPYTQLSPFNVLLKSGGKIVVSTPNLSSIVHIAKLLMKIPHYDPPEMFFTPVAQENLQIHRREYMPSEIQEAFEKMGYKHQTKYFIYNEPKSLQYRMMYIIGNIIPRFREGMLLLGQKP